MQQHRGKVKLSQMMLPGDLVGRMVEDVARKLIALDRATLVQKMLECAHDMTDRDVIRRQAKAEPKRLSEAEIESGIEAIRAFAVHFALKVAELPLPELLVMAGEDQVELILQAHKEGRCDCGAEKKEAQKESIH